MSSRLNGLDAPEAQRMADLLLNLLHSVQEIEDRLRELEINEKQIQALEYVGRARAYRQRMED